MFGFVVFCCGGIKSLCTAVVWVWLDRSTDRQIWVEVDGGLAIGWVWWADAERVGEVDGWG